MPSTLQLLALLAASATVVTAGPYPKDDLHDLGYSFLQARACDSYCGADNQLCCSGGAKCTTLDGNIATCTGGSGGGWGAAATTTWTETHTYTSTRFTEWDPAPEPTAGVDCVPKNDQQEACGTICCAGWQTCAYQGQCSAKSGFAAPSTVVITSGGKTTTQYSAPYRVTGTTTVVNSGAPTATASGTDSSSATATAIGADGDSDGGSGGSGGSNNGLSGGEIAGIVIGSLAGAALLLLLAFCCIARGLWSICFGRKDRDDHSTSSYSDRRHHPGWFGGMLGGGGGHHGSEKSHHGGKKWLGLAGIAAALFALLNLKKEKKPARRGASRSSRSRSRYTDSSYYTYSDASSPQSSSDGRRTYQSRRTGDSRRGPRSYYSKSGRS